MKGGSPINIGSETWITAKYWTHSKQLSGETTGQMSLASHKSLNRFLAVGEKEEWKLESILIILEKAEKKPRIIFTIIQTWNLEVRGDKKKDRYLERGEKKKSRNSYMRKRKLQKELGTDSKGEDKVFNSKARYTIRNTNKVALFCWSSNEKASASS